MRAINTPQIRIHERPHSYFYQIVNHQLQNCNAKKLKFPISGRYPAEHNWILQKSINQAPVTKAKFDPTKYHYDNEL